MKVIAIADLHGELINIEDSFDLLLICGDVCPNFSWDTVTDTIAQECWLKSKFTEWVNSLNFNNESSKVVFIAGNHDFVLDKNFSNKSVVKGIRKYFEDKCGGRIIYLDNEEYDFKYTEGEKDYSIKIYGTPYCKVFGNWAFMRESISHYYRGIPDNLDILISHDAPKVGDYGLISQGRQAGINAGNPKLAEYIAKKKPKLALHGHIHSSSHKLEDIDDTIYGCVSVNDEYYVLSYQPLILEYVEGKLKF